MIVRPVGSVIILSPLLTIARPAIDEIIDALDEAPAQVGSAPLAAA